MLLTQQMFLECVHLNSLVVPAGFEPNPASAFAAYSVCKPFVGYYLLLCYQHTTQPVIEHCSAL